MDIENLVHMANRIAEFFEAMPDTDEARDGVAQHLQRYWEPRMRRELAAHVDATGGTGLRPLVLRALRERPVAALGVNR
jgi:formate dehydrogenase subunit delta